MVPGVDAVVVRTPFEDFILRVVRGGAPPNGEALELARWAASQVRFGVEMGEAGVLRAAREVWNLLDGAGSGFGVDRPSCLDPSSSPGGAFGGIAGRLEEELLSGRLAVERERIPPLTEHGALFERELPPLPPPRRDSATRTFEVRFVDEVGKAISGIDAEFTADGPQTRATNAAGVALLEGVESSVAKVAILDPEALSKVLDPRWRTLRPGQPPKEANTTEVVFKGGALGPFPLKAEQPNTVVIKPPLGQLFVELWDKSGRVRHARRSYEITGPQAFEGTTDEAGRLRHEDVFPGDYRLSLGLDFFEATDPDRAMDIVEGPLVVLEAGGAEPQLRRLGAVPRSVLAELHSSFNTNKAFLLPTALPSLKKLRKLYLQNAPCRLLVVGHADSRGGSAFNDQLSLERAQATIAYLKDDVDAWLAFYEPSVDAKKRWGKTEDRLMIVSMPDFVEKPKGEDAVKWYQRTRGLFVDGTAGDKTRRALVTEYLSLDGASLEDFAGAIEATAHGCGESFPLEEEEGQASSPAPDEQRRPSDRRVELFFFDPEFGITPNPPSELSTPGSAEYGLWRKRVSERVELREGDFQGPKVTFVELADAHFRTDSAVVLPEGEDPSGDGEHQAYSSVGVIATALRFNDEHGERRLLVAGHTDTTAGDETNAELSRQRAQVALALLEGDRACFAEVCNARHVPADINQILSWVSRAFDDLAFDCDPGKVSPSVNPGVVRKFQTAFNENKATLGSPAADLTVDGAVGELTWGALFDCYELALQRELGEDATGVAALRSQLKFADDARKALGFGEHFPVEELGVDDFSSQTNRRVEFHFFAPGEEPDLAHAEDDPETSELYLPGYFQRTPLEPMASAKAFTAVWDAVTTSMLETRTMQIDAPGLPAGVPMTFTVTAVGHGLAGTVEAVSQAGSVAAPFDEWDAMEGIEFLGDDPTLPVVDFVFEAEGGGRRVRATLPTRYEDQALFTLVLRLPSGDQPMPAEPFVVSTRWGRIKGVTDSQALLDVRGLPPGGANIIVRDHTLAHFGVLELGSDLDGG